MFLWVFWLAAWRVKASEWSWAVPLDMNRARPKKTNSPPKMGQCAISGCKRQSACGECGSGMELRNTGDMISIKHKSHEYPAELGGEVRVLAHHLLAAAPARLAAEPEHRGPGHVHAAGPCLTTWIGASHQIAGTKSTAPARERRTRAGHIADRTAGGAEVSESSCVSDGPN